MLEATRNPLNVTTHDPTTNSNGGRLATADTPVIVLNWNGWEYTFACLQSLRAAEDVTTVWLVDNGSLVDRTDETRTLWPGLRVVRLDQNYGFAGGMNQALRLAASEGYAFAYLLNNDATVVPGFLRAALDAVAPGVAVVGSRIVYADGRSIAFDGEVLREGRAICRRAVRNTPSPARNGAGMLVVLRRWRSAAISTSVSSAITRKWSCAGGSPRVDARRSSPRTPSSGTFGAAAT